MYFITCYEIQKESGLKAVLACLLRVISCTLHKIFDNPFFLFRNSESRPNWTYGQKSVYKDLDAPTDEGSSPHLPPITSNSSGIGVSHTASQVQDLKRIRSPPSLPVDERILRNSRMTRGR